MGNFRACFFVAVSALAACGDDGGSSTQKDAAIDVAIDSKVFMDAPPPMFNLSCIGHPAPTTAPNTIDLSGTVQVADFVNFQFSVNPVDMAQVNVCTTTACNGAVPTANSDATGAWAITGIATTGAPLNAYLEMTAQNQRDTFVYPGTPFIGNQAGIPILTFGPGAVDLVANLGCAAADPIMAVAVTDCDNMPISDTANINIVVKQNGAVVASADATDLSTLPGAPAQLAGLFLVCGVPANNATNIGATYNGMTLLAHDVKMVAGTTTTTQVRPGY